MLFLHPENEGYRIRDVTKQGKASVWLAAVRAGLSQL